MTAKTNLPTKSQWPNTATTQYKTLTDISGNSIVAPFSYSGYAARLLSYQDLALNDDSPWVTNGLSFSRWGFLYENTTYVNSATYARRDFWLETPNVSTTTQAYYVSGNNRNLSSMIVNYMSSLNNGARPLIEINLSDMRY